MAAAVLSPDETVPVVTPELSESVRIVPAKETSFRIPEDIFPDLSPSAYSDIDALVN